MSTIASPQPTVRRRLDLRAFAAGGTVTAALIAAAVIVFGSLAAYVAFKGAPVGSDAPPADSVTVGAPKAAAATLGRAPRVVAATPAAPTAIAPAPAPVVPAANNGHRYGPDGGRPGRQQRRHPDRSRLGHDHGPLGHAPRGADRDGRRLHQRPGRHDRLERQLGPGR